MVQLNDIWAGPSWSSINSDGTWKLLHYQAASFFQPVAVSGRLSQAGDQVSVFLANDLSVGVAGLLEVDAVPWSAEEEGEVVALLRAPGVSVPPFAAGLMWSASLPDILGSNGTAQQWTAADVFLRLRFCPSSIQNQAGYSNPFAATLAGALSAGQSMPNSRSEVISDGSQGCSAPAVGPDAGPEQCAAAYRLLGCTESILFLTELKDARLPDAEVAAEVTLALLADGGGGSGGSTAWDGSGTTSEVGSSVWVAVNSSRIAAFVALETSLAGRFNASGFLLLPWEGPTTVEFLPQTEEFPSSNISLDSGELQQALEADLSVMWLQKALAAVQPAASSQATPGPPPQATGVRAWQPGFPWLVLCCCMMSAWVAL